MKYKYKEEKSFEVRYQEAQKVLTKYPDRIPVRKFNLKYFLRRLGFQFFSNFMNIVINNNNNNH